MNNFFLTAIVQHSRGIFEPINDTHTFGYYSNIDDAISAVLSNVGSMCECKYDYLVIEEIGEGVHPRVYSEYWFIWSDEKSRWERLSSKPERFNSITNWALG